MLIRLKSNKFSLILNVKGCGAIKYNFFLQMGKVIIFIEKFKTVAFKLDYNDALIIS